MTITRTTPLEREALRLAAEARIRPATDNSFPALLAALCIGLAAPGLAFALAVHWMLSGRWVFGLLALLALLAVFIVLAVCTRSSQISKERGE